MHKYATVTALVIALITMLTPAVSYSRGLPIQNEAFCDTWGATRWGVWCHCTFECSRNYSYVVRQPCRNRTLSLCEHRVVPVAGGCVRNCMTAKGVPQPHP
jgi:hypothetical protein